MMGKIYYYELYEEGRRSLIVLVDKKGSFFSRREVKCFYEGTRLTTIQSRECSTRLIFMTKAGVGETTSKKSYFAEEEEEPEAL